MTEKSDSRKWDMVAVIISIVSLIASVVFSSYSFVLANQANNLTVKSLELQNMLSNFTSIIIPSPAQAQLSWGGYYSNGTTSPTVTTGWLNISLVVITPHYGLLYANIEDFTPSDEYQMLDTPKTHLTDVSYASGYQANQHLKYVISGINQLNIEIQLQASFYPNSQKLPVAPDSAVTFPIGELSLQMELFDSQTSQTTTRPFVSNIFVTVRT
jgi:hypothetical protein